MAVNAKTLNETEFFYGHKACAGCGGSLAVRIALKVLGENAFAVLPAGCMSAVGFNYPHLCFGNNAIISTFAGTGSMLTGVQAGLKAQGITDFHAVGFAGDGGTADIGLQALSGAIDRNDDILYICYDNEAYMNTGIQKSSLTPFGARTTTTPDLNLRILSAGPGSAVLFWFHPDLSGIKGGSQRDTDPEDVPGIRGLPV